MHRAMGLRAVGPCPLRHVTLAYIDTPDARAALHAAIGMARELGAEIHLVTVVPETRVLPSFGDVRRFSAEQHAAYAEMLAGAAATVPEDVRCTTEVMEGVVGISSQRVDSAPTKHRRRPSMFGISGLA
jgi:hypothetical protein